MTTIAVLIVLAALYYAAKKTERGPSAPPPPQDPLDVPLLQWNDRDNFTGRELLRSASVIGASGSGKTSGVGKILMRALAARADVAVLIIASKPEDRATVEDIAAEAGRKLTVFGPNEPHRFNLIAGQCQAGADAREITDCILTTTEALTRNEGQSGESFWKFNETRMIHNAVEVIKQAFGTVDTWAIQRFINGAPTSRDQLESEEWRKGYFYTTSEKAHAKSKTLIESQDLELAEQYFLEEYPSMADKTRSSIIASVMGRLHAFNTGIVRELIGGATTVTPKVFDGGDWVFVDMPVSIHGPSGAVVAAAWKYATQRHILRRMATPETTITCVWIDEFQNHITGFDSDFLAECRSHKGCMVTLTQSIHSFFSSMGGAESQSKTKALLTNYGTKIFLTLGDDETAQYANSLIGRTKLLMAGSSMSRPFSIYEEILGQANATTSLNEHFEQRLQNAVFLHGLRCGGPENGYLCDGIIIKNGSCFSSGENWIKASFSQR